MGRRALLALLLDDLFRHDLIGPEWRESWAEIGDRIAHAQTAPNFSSQVRQYVEPGARHSGWTNSQQFSQRSLLPEIGPATMCEPS